MRWPPPRGPVGPGGGALSFLPGRTAGVAHGIEVAMPLRFNGVLRDAGLDPGEVRLIRHQDGRASPGRSPCELWRDDPTAFHAYQSDQGTGAASRKKLGAPYWAVFVADAFGDTLFVGLFAAAYRGPLEYDRPTPHVAGETGPAGSLGIYDLEPDDRLEDLAGRLVIDWGGASGPGFDTRTDRTRRSSNSAPAAASRRSRAT